MAIDIGKSAGDKLPSTKRTSAASHGRRTGTVFRIGPDGSTGIHESWVRPDGTIERNIKMDLVVSAAGKLAPTPKKNGFAQS